MNTLSKGNSKVKIKNIKNLRARRKNSSKIDLLPKKLTNGTFIIVQCTFIKIQ